MEIRVRNVTYSYPGAESPVFEDFSFKASSGITLIKGFSGCGKSTLLRLVASLLKPQSGEVWTSAESSFGSSRFLREEVGFVFQQFNLLPLASVSRNILLSSRLAGVPQSETEKWIQLLGLEPIRDKKPKDLSGGQQQRAAIARALSKSPSLLLLDEPTSGLDDLNTDIISLALRKELPEGTACLIATHDNRLTEIADEVLNFNSFLPVEEHLQAVVGESNSSV